MKKVKTEEINLKDIKHIENSRLRDLDDVSDLMQDIEQRGLLENVAVRINDNALIFGNRRVRAFEKLGYTKILADFYDELSDEDLLITNIAENIKRKDIGSIEIGRICKILQKREMKVTEISIKLGIASSRVNSAIAAYNITLNTPFEKLVIFGSRGGRSGHKGIPETLIWKIQNSLARARKLTKEDWVQLLNAIESGELTTEKISQLRKILLSSPKLSIIRALDILTRCRVVHIWYHFNEEELSKNMKKEKCNNEQEFVRLLVKKYNKELLF